MNTEKGFNTALKIHIDEKNKLEHVTRLNMKIPFPLENKKVLVTAWETTITSQVGRVLVDFIESDFNNIDDFKNIFIGYAMFTLVSEEDKKKLVNSKGLYYSEIIDIVKKYHNKLKNEFISIQKQIIDILDYCIFDDSKKYFEGTTSLQKFVFLNTLSDTKNKYPFLENNHAEQYLVNAIKTHNKQIQTEEELEDIISSHETVYYIRDTYISDSFFFLLYLELYHLLKETMILKKCKNCDRYFITDRIAKIYCDNIAPSDFSKTCQQIGPTKKYEERIGLDSAITLYRKIYKKKERLAAKKGESYIQEYENFKQYGKGMKEAYQTRKITKDQFVKWLKDEDCE